MDITFLLSIIIQYNQMIFFKIAIETKVRMLCTSFEYFECLKLYIDIQMNQIELIKN